MNRKKVFGIGFGKTGTTSLAAAMKMLGYRVKHGLRTIDEVQECDFANDIAVSWRFRFLDYVYPRAKFILTVRDLSSWLSSCRAHAGRRCQRGPLRRLEQRFMCYGRTDFDESEFAFAYRRHTDAVVSHFRDRPEKLLIMNICSGDGWTVLCPFLGVPAPSSAFPYQNRRA